MPTPKRTTKSYDDTTAAAREIIDAQDRAHDAKTARLRKARLDKEAAGPVGARTGQVESKGAEDEGEAMKIFR
jgi:hypothetical protein